MLALFFLPTGYEGALSYQNADRVPALVLSTDESDIYDTGLVRTGDQRCRVRILGGQFAGTEVDAVNRLSGSLAQDKLFSAGAKAFVVVSHSGDAITTVYMTDHFRLGKEALLAGLFLLLLLIFARGTGLRAILSFIDTILLTWKVLVPSLLNGYNPIWVSLGLVMALTALILMLIYGWDRRFLIGRGAWDSGDGCVGRGVHEPVSDPRCGHGVERESALCRVSASRSDEDLHCVNLPRLVRRGHGSVGRYLLGSL